MTSRTGRLERQEVGRCFVDVPKARHENPLAGFFVGQTSAEQMVQLDQLDGAVDIPVRFR